MDNIRTKRASAFLERVRAWIAVNFGGTDIALYHMGSVTAALVIGFDLASTFWPHAAGYMLLFTAVLALLELGLWLAGKLFRHFLDHSLSGLMGLALLFGSAAFMVEQGGGEGWTWRIFIFAGCVTAALGLLAVSWWSLLRRRRFTPGTVAAGVLSALAAGLLAMFLFSEGFDDPVIQKYRTLIRQQESGEALDFGQGPYRVAALDYGPGAAVEAGTVDLTGYMSRDTGDLVGNYVDVYWDYDLDEVPMRGRVWYPAERGNCPVLFIAHGNHEISTESYLGYDYLGTYLASHGYVVVSVDQNACNMLVDENDGRAVLLLEHIGLLLDFNGETENPLYRKIDPDNIAVAGHSRGGEMAATAYLFNGYDRYPENGTIRFDYNYAIKSIIAIAPTVDQYRPADHSVELADVNYLLLHGMADRDVTSFMGMAQYENISFTGEGDYLKTALYIAGANHGQFNSLWGAYDQAGASAALLNVESLLDETDQQKIACVFVKAFLDVTLLGDNTHRDLLTDWDGYASQLPETVYAQCWETSGFTPVADFEEDSDLESGTLEGVELSVEQVDLWREEAVGFGGQDTHAVRLRWQDEGSYHLEFPAMDLADAAVHFDICDLDSGAVERGDLSLVDGEVILTDEDGGTASARISDFNAVFPILPVRTDKLDYLFGTSVYKKAVSTVAIPARGFVSPGNFDVSRIVEITFDFDGSGQVLLDNIGIEAHWAQ